MTDNPKRRRITRLQNYKPLIYNERYHPADDVLRPAQAKKLKATEESAQQRLSVESSATSQEHDSSSSRVEDEEDSHPQMARRRSSRTSGQHAKPNYDMRYSTNGLQRVSLLTIVRLHPSFDEAFRPAAVEAATRRKSRESRQQRAAADASSRLDTVTKVDDFEPAPKPRHELIELAMSEIQFIAIPAIPERSPLTNQNSTVRRMEDFDAFEKTVGSKYWRHNQDSLVRSMTNKVDEHKEAENEDSCSQEAESSRSRIGEPVIVYEDQVLEDGFKNETSFGEEFDSVLFETMRNNTSSSEHIMSDREVAEIMSPTAQYTAEFPPARHKNMKPAIASRTTA